MQNGAMTPCTPMQGNVQSDGSMQFGMMPSQQQHPQMAMPVNMQQQTSFGMSQNVQGHGQGSPFPMPLSPPHDLAQTGFPGTQPAYYENGGMQLVSVPVGSCPQ